MKIGIALSGGGIRGIAHAGVLKALEENNISIDIIGGCSSGSMIASLYAIGYKPEEIYILFKKYAKAITTLNKKPIIYGIQNHFGKNKRVITGLKDGMIIENIFNKLALEKGVKNINEVCMPIVIPSVDISEAKEYIFTNNIPNKIEDKLKYITDIEIGKAIRASSSFPAVFTPCSIKKHFFMDGGALDNIPINEVKYQGADKLIAVKFNSNKIDENSNLMDIAMKTIDIMGNKISEKCLEKSDVVLNVHTNKVGLLDVEELDNCYKYGYDCAMKNMEVIKERIK